MSTNQNDPCRMEEDRTTSTVEDEPEGTTTTINRVERHNNTISSSRTVSEVPDTGNNVTGSTNEQRTANSTTRVKTKVNTVTVNNLNYPVVIQEEVDVVFDSVEGFNRVQPEITSATNPINTTIDTTVFESTDTIKTVITVEFLEPEGTQETPFDLFVRLFYKFGNLTAGKSSIIVGADKGSEFGLGPENFGGKGIFGSLQSTRPGKKFFWLITMTIPQLHDTGEEYAMRFGLNDTITVGLFNRIQDTLSDGDDISDITTEPDGSNYSRQSSSFSPFDSANDFTDGWAVSNDSSMSFDVSGSTTTVDAFFISKTFQSQDKGDSSPEEHLIYTGLIQHPEDIQEESITKMKIENNSIGIRYGVKIDGDELLEGGNNRIISHGLATGYDLSTLDLGQATFDISFTPQGVEFDSIGGRMYITRANGDIYQYKLRSLYGITDAVFEKKASYEAANKVTLRGFRWNGDGTKAFEIFDGGDSPDLGIFGYTASEPFEIDTLTATGNTITRSQGSDRLDGMSPGGMCWNDDGTVLVYSDVANPFLTASRNIHQDELSTPFDLSSVVNTSTIFNGRGDVAFRYDGTELYQQNGDTIEVYSLSTPFDITSTNQVDSTFNIQDGSGLGIVFNTSPKYIGNN